MNGENKSNGIKYIEKIKKALLYPGPVILSIAQTAWNIWIYFPPGYSHLIMARNNPPAGRLKYMLKGRRL